MLVASVWIKPSPRATGRCGRSRSGLNNVVSGKSGISPEMAVRLSKAFGSAPEAWLRMQMNYDLSRLKTTIQVKRVKAAPRPLDAALCGRPAKRERQNHEPVTS